MDLLAALALVLVIEGLLPFISPQTYRRMVAEMVRLGDNQIRNIGLVIMIIGVVLLFLVRH